MGMELDVYHDPCFTLNDAKMHIYVFDVPKGTIHDWVIGRPTYEPLIDIAQRTPPRLSFINLVELYILACIRRKFRITMQNIRPAIEFLKTELKSEHPFVEYSFQTDGISLFFNYLGETFDISKGGQQTFDFIDIYLKRIEYGHSGVPLKFFPFTRLDKNDEKTPKYISINPNICFGRPILESISVPVEIISQRFWAGESHDRLKEEFKISAEELDEAIRVGGYYLKAA